MFGILSSAVNFTCSAAEGHQPQMWALERWWVTEKWVKGKVIAGTRGILPCLGGSPWSRKRAEWRSQAVPLTHHQKKKYCRRGQIEAECSLVYESCSWVSMMTARSWRRRPSCQETRLCKANPRHTHVSLLVEAFKPSGYQLYQLWQFMY